MLQLMTETAKLQMKQSFARPMFRFCLIANPFLNTILLYEMFLGAGEEDFFSYVVLGAGLMGLWGCICFSSAGDINRERYMGTLALVFAAPSSFQAVIYGKIIGNTLLSLFSFVVSVATAALLFRVPVAVHAPGFFAVAFLAAVVSFIAISSVIACLLTLSRKTELYMNLLELPLALLCGFVFPAEMLPKPLQLCSALLSPTHAAKLLRMSVTASPDRTLFLRELAVLFALTLLYLAGAVLLYKRIDKRVRIRATLDVA